MVSRVVDRLRSVVCATSPPGGKHSVRNRRSSVGDVHTKSFEVRWDEVDPNQHMRHTVYLTYGADARVDVFNQNGIEFGSQVLGAVAPVLFREEAVYRREVRFGESVQVRTSVTKLSDDAGRWSMRHEVIRPDGELAATIEADGAWIDLATRKLAVPPPDVAAAFRALFDRAQADAD